LINLSFFYTFELFKAKPTASQALDALTEDDKVDVTKNCVSSPKFAHCIKKFAPENVSHRIEPKK